MSAETTKAHCNHCAGERNHQALHVEKSSWSDDEATVWGNDKYEMLKCMGCDAIKLRHTSWFSEDEETSVAYYPPATFRRQPDWFSDLWLELAHEDDFVEQMLKEVYVALQNKQPRLAAMGIRSLLETIMIAKAGDQGSFAKNISEFESRGFVSRAQRERLEAIIEAGHATTHRTFRPSNADVITLVDIAEHIVESVYLHQAKSMR